MNYKAMEKLIIWFADEHDLNRNHATIISNKILQKHKQVNEDTSIIKTDSRYEIYIPEKLKHEIEYETKTIKKEVLAKEYKTFPFFAPYLKPKKTWIEVKIKTPKYNYNNTRSIEMKPWGYSYQNLTAYLSVGYDQMGDNLYIRCQASDSL